MFPFSPPHRANRTRVQQALGLSANLQADLEAALRAAVPAAKIVRSPPASIDADLFRIAHAPLLITGEMGALMNFNHFFMCACLQPQTEP